MAVYKIADLYLQIEPKHEYTRQQLEEYKTAADRVDACISPFPGELEFMGLLHQLGLELLEHHQGMYLHGAALEYEGRVYLFTAPSGTGKSTHMALWKQLLGDRVRILNGDKPLLRCVDGQIRLYSGPWRGKEGWGENGSGLLAGIFVLKRAAENRVEPMSDLDALNVLLAATIYPEQEQGMEKLLELMGQILQQVPVQALYCNTHISAAETALASIAALHGND